jgi:electron transfer flavoprotein alpha subunit
VRMTVLVFSENLEVAAELLGKGRELANDLGTKLAAALVGSGVKGKEKELFAYGADVVYVVDHPSLSTFFPETYTEALAKVVELAKPEVLLIGATKRGKETAPRLATKLNAGCAAGATSLRIDKEKKLLIAERPAISAMVVATEFSKTKPQIATVPPRTFEKPPRDDSRKGEVVEVKAEIPPVEKKVVELKAKEMKGIKIEDAELITSCGRGFRKKEDLKLLEELAGLIGATLGCSRPIAADLKWLPEDHWVGLSGHKVKPRMYMAVGISGQVQHLAGMRDSKIIVAINKDPDAPIFKVADYGIVGDLYQVIPALISYLKSKKG